MGELLVYLLENGGAASSERITEAFWPGSNPKAKRQTLWELIHALRDLLGWPGSVASSRQAYRLDPSVGWTYDVEQARTQQRVEGRFMEGVESEWVEEVNEELERLRVRQGFGTK